MTDWTWARLNGIVIPLPLSQINDYHGEWKYIPLGGRMVLAFEADTWPVPDQEDHDER